MAKKKSEKKSGKIGFLEHIRGHRKESKKSEKRAKK